jgi:cysteine-rich repeat protein
VSRGRNTVAAFVAVINPVVGIAVSVGEPPPAQSVEVPFTERPVSTTVDFVTSLFATDLDGDGDIDVLSASKNDDKIAWYQNDGGSTPTFIEMVISITADDARSVFAKDLDGDGDMDVLSASFGDNKLAWYESDGGSPPTFAERVLPIVDEFDRPTSVFATDVNGDGYTDVLAALWSNGKIVWYENDGGLPPSFISRVITINAEEALSVFAADLDGDGDIDVLAATDRGFPVAWYENDGGLSPSFTQRLIPSSLGRGKCVFAADVDGDGDQDVLLADSVVVYYENDGGSPPTFTERDISTTAHSRVFATDLDGDGDTDVLSAALVSGINWYENTTPACGNGLVEGTEQCDDGNTNGGDGCDSTCQIEPGFFCQGVPSICFPEGIPTVSEWGLIAMTLLTLTAGTLVFSRINHSSSPRTA